MLNRVLFGEFLSLLKGARIDGDQRVFATFVGRINELSRDPVRTNNSEAYHRQRESPVVEFLPQISMLSWMCAGLSDRFF